jgi:hypothetical protein
MTKKNAHRGTLKPFIIGDTPEKFANKYPSAIDAATAVADGITRLTQLGWQPQRTLCYAAKLDELAWVILTGYRQRTRVRVVSYGVLDIETGADVTNDVFMWSQEI